MTAKAKDKVAIGDYTPAALAPSNIPTNAKITRNCARIEMSLFIAVPQFLGLAAPARR